MSDKESDPIMNRRGAVLALVMTAALAALHPALAAADTPVVMAFGGEMLSNQSGPNTADWSMPGCQPGQLTWYWYDPAYTNIEVDSPFDAYAGDATVWAQMNSTTPCSAVDTGSMTLEIRNNNGISTDGNVNCTLPGSFIRVGTNLVMVVGGTCVINNRPPVSVQLQGDDPAFLGAQTDKLASVPDSTLGVYEPPSGGYEFTTTGLSG